jgi:hypothetical protein
LPYSSSSLTQSSSSSSSSSTTKWLLTSESESIRIAAFKLKCY